MPNKFVAAWPASKSNEETVEAWQRWRNEGELLMVKEERRRKFAAAWPASKSNAETVEAWQRWRNQGELFMVKGERCCQAGEQSFERIFANQRLY